MSTIAKGASSRGGKAGKTAGRNGLRANVAAACPSCGSKVQHDARFCQNCGKSLDRSGWLTPQTLTVLGSAVITLVALGLIFASVIDVGSLSSTSPATPAAPTASASGQPPDLSTMSPREAADRLFNRVMMADEQGNAAEVDQFSPMAVSAYEMLENLDTDALFHVGLIHAAAGNIDDARSYADRLKAVVPNHLLASFLEHRLAEAEGDSAAAEIALQRFHAHYHQEISVDLPEYDHHRAIIENFRTTYPAAEANNN